MEAPAGTWDVRGVTATRRFTDARDFLVALDPALSPELGRSSASEYWVYRGQADARWRLSPSAFREDAASWTDAGWKRLGRGSERSCRSQIQAEADTVRRFFTLADRHGFAVPEDRRELREYVGKMQDARFLEELSGRAGRWPPALLLPVLGLAQHHRIPTRLLDWTHDSLTAAYFAARDACVRAKRGRAEPDLCVWVFFKVFVERGVGAPLIEMVSVPTATNRNLHAQKGLFVVMRSGVEDLDAAADLRPLESRFEDLAPQLEERFPKRSAFQKMFGKLVVFLRYVLPTREAPRLLKLLAARGVTAAILFPGLDGVASAMQDEDLWVNA